MLPYVTGNALATNGSVKAWVKWTRIFQLVLRCFEVLCAVGLLVVLVLIKGMDATTGWVMRIIVCYGQSLYGMCANVISPVLQSSIRSTLSIIW